MSLHASPSIGNPQALLLGGGAERIDNIGEEVYYLQDSLI